MESTESLNLELVLITGTAGMLLLTTAIAVFIFLFQRKLIKRKLAYQQVEDLLHKQELKSAYALMEGQDQERQRIAEEMHDNLGSSLVTLTMYADTFLKSVKDAEQQALAQKVHEIAQKAHEEARRLSHRLDSSVLKYFGLEASLRDLANTVNKSERINVQLNLDLPELLENEISLNLYRITQELVNNTLKHADARNISIAITHVSGEYISYIYEDDGKGILENANTKGMGMRNISSRVEKLNGQLSLDKKGQKGFTAIIEIPIK